MKVLCCVLLLFGCITTKTYSQSVAINTNGAAPNASAMLDISSTTKGLLAPRMTTVQRNAILTPAEGLMVFDTDVKSLWYYSSGLWSAVPSSSNTWLTTGNNIATGFIGTLNATPLNFRVNNTELLRLNSTGILSFLNDQSTLQFTATNNPANKPMIQMFTSGTQNSNRMILSHSPAFPSWGIEYRDTTDVIYFRDGSTRKFAFELASGHMGIGAEDPAFPLDITGRMRLRANGNLSNSPGIWFSNNTNTFDRAFLGMESNDSTLGIYSQHLGKWGIQFELMREPRIGINIVPNSGGDVARAELHLMHTNFGGANDGIRIQNEGANLHYWNLYTSNTTGDFEFYKSGIKRVTINQTSGAYTAVSDERLKKNIRLMPPGVLSKLMLLRPTTYQFIDMPNDEGQFFKADDRYYNGFMAQEVEKIFPELVYKGADNPAQDFYTMDYAGFGVLAVKAIQEQQKIITTQQELITTQQEQLNALQHTVGELKQQVNLVQKILAEKK